jgi:phospholipid/cholesterol/gamma-HCH transport system substrate-binding protein
MRIKARNAMTRRGIETLVGVFVLLGFVAIGYLALKAANLAAMTVGETYTVTARFDNIGGLKPRAPVKSAGVTVGRVASISLDPQTFQGLVTLELEKRFEFPKDTSASILTAGLLGDQYVGLNPGGDDKNLMQGDTIKLTQSAVVLENLIGQFLYNRAAEGGDAKK